MKKAAIWLLIALAAVPLLTISVAFYPAIEGKIVAYRAAAFLVVLITFMISIGKDQEVFLKSVREKLRSPIVIAVTTSMLTIGISTLFAQDRFSAFFGELSRGEGFVTFFSLYVLFVAMAVFFDRRAWRASAIITSIASVTMILVQFSQLAPLNTRPSALMANPIFLAGWYLFAVFAGMYLMRISTKGQIWLRVLGILTIIASVYGILLTRTRGTLLAMVISALICAGIAAVYGKGIMMGKYSLRKVGLWIAGVVVVFGFLFGLTSNAKVWSRIPGLDRVAEISTDTSTIQSRVLFLQISKKGFGESSALRKTVGWGWDNYGYFWNANYDPAVYLFDQSYADRAHNKLVDMLIMTGIIGLLAYLWIWVTFLRASVRMIPRDPRLAFALLFVSISYFLHNLVAFDMPVILFLFYALLAFVVTTSYEK